MSITEPFCSQITISAKSIPDSDAMALILHMSSGLLPDDTFLRKGNRNTHFERFFWQGMRRERAGYG